LAADSIQDPQGGERRGPVPSITQTAAAPGRRGELRGVLIAEFEKDRIKRFRQYWDEVALLEGLGPLPEE
jgi:hypothetical protein